MKKMMVVVVLTALTLLLGALSMAQYMNEKAELSVPVPLEWSTKERALEAEVKEKDRSQGIPPAQDLIAKKKQTEEIGYYNFFSDIGGQLSESFNTISRSFLASIMSFFEEVLNAEKNNES
ncbi:hypothetical protein BTS2_2878 [Bacillus sp. TS-2]|nr:hypothetical protein BTS2_2878 [Bacillus sp. TS-2]